MNEKWARISSASAVNLVKWDVELSWILRIGAFTGVRVNIALGDKTAIGQAEGLVIDPSNPTTEPARYLRYILHRLASNGLKCLLGLGGDGPDKSTTGAGTWRTVFNSGTDWLSKKRPPLGNSNGLFNRVVAIKQAAIDLMITVYESYGLDPFEYCFIELGNEPGIGGAGAPNAGTESSWFSAFGQTSTDYGCWDRFTATNQGCSFVQWNTLEMAALNLRNLRCVAPTFALIDTARELQTFGREWPVSSTTFWYDLVRVKTELMFGVNLYYEAFDRGTAGVHPEQYVWPSLSPARYARIAVDGVDGRGEKSGDHACTKWRIQTLRDDPIIANSRIVNTEAGVSHQFLGQSDDPGTGTDPVGSMSANYHLNYQRNHDAVIAYLQKLEEVGFEWVTLFTITDSSASITQQFGVFPSTLSDSGRPVLQTKETYSAALAWSKVYGLPTTKGLPPDYADAGTYWNIDFERGDSEDVP